ncbi:MAG: alpha-galactosidase [Eubacteriales bacterium]
MISNVNSIFVLGTKDTTYCMHVLPSGHLEHLYYGEKVTFSDCYQGIFPQAAFVEGNLNTYDIDYPTIGLENRPLELSTRGKGDIREPMVELIYSNGSTTCDFLYDSFYIEKKQNLESLPSSYDESGETETLVMVLKDKNIDAELHLYYSVFVDTNVIVRSCKLWNKGQDDIRVRRLLSCQLDFIENEYTVTTFKGAWAREMNRQDVKCSQGIIVNDSKTGGSSNRSNPFVMLSTSGTTEEQGDCYACNLIYSGNHYEAVEVNGYQMTHFLCGINPFGFEYTLASNEVFESPEAVLTYSSHGYDEISQQMHAFVRAHIVRGVWKKKERPVLLNSWEASYFDFNESKLLKLAKAGSKVGIELFVLDDGWFGVRNDDTTSLGDWYVNKKKLPNGLKGLADKINTMGMKFGIWVEPEMVSYDSECYREHPEYAVEIPDQRQSLGRNQLVLDLTQTVVQDYIIEQMKQVFSSANISYVKWDMNRIVSDAFSQGLEASKQGEFYHRYIIGLYRVLEELTSAFPEVLFEACASGGNRSDLGMLCYMPQMWASDNTDAICRAQIQTGYSYGYPMSVIGAHVSSCPNHQTLRNTSLDTRFQVACFGVLGYECNLADMSVKDLEAIKHHIEWYKKYRNVLQYGTYHRLTSNENGTYKWMSVSQDKSCGIGLYLQTQVTPNSVRGHFKTRGLAEEKKYHFTNLPLVFDVREFGDLINMISPIHIKQDGIIHNVAAQFVKMHSEKEDYVVTGSVLNKIGIRLKQGFGGTGFNDEVRFFQDYSSRLYMIEEERNL